MKRIVRLATCCLVCCCLSAAVVPASANDVTATPVSKRGLVIPARDLILRTVHLPGGDYSRPQLLNLPGTEYVVDGAITAAGTAFLIRASRIVLNLNGNRIVYNQSTPGDGVYVDGWNLSDVAIVNGFISQGAANSEGDQYGAGNNPIRTHEVNRLQVARISARYGGRDVSGFKLSAVNSIIEDNVLEDTWSSGTLKNRHQGIDAIVAGNLGGNVFRNNTIINCRQRGIKVADRDEVYGNSISIRSLATNSYGIAGITTGSHVKVHHNTITGVGEHPIGIFFSGASSGMRDVEVSDNVIEVQTTKIGAEYGDKPACWNPKTPCGNYAVGFRTTWGITDLKVQRNIIKVISDSAMNGTYSPTGAAVKVSGKGRGLMVAINPGQKALFSDNQVTVLDRDGSGNAYGIACTGGNASSELVFEHNTVTSNVVNVALGDEYGACGGFPLFIGNSFVRSGNFPSYRTVKAESGGFFEATGRFVSNSYRGGAAVESIEINAKGGAAKSVYFGREVTATVSSPRGGAISGARVEVLSAAPGLESAGTSDAQGAVRLIMYEYQVHDANNASNRALKDKVAAPSFRVSIGDDVFVTLPDSAVSSRLASGSGTLVPKLYCNGSVADTVVLKISF